VAIYKISPAAEQDSIDIYLRGLNKWGRKEADEFQLRIVLAFHTLVNNPDLGRPIAIRPQLQRYDLKPYVIFYRKFSYGIRVARILYKNRVMEKYL
jgi:plasmid stabilization system protein ParE